MIRFPAIVGRISTHCSLHAIVSLVYFSQRHPLVELFQKKTPAFGLGLAFLLLTSDHDPKDPSQTLITTTPSRTVTCTYTPLAPHPWAHFLHFSPYLTVLISLLPFLSSSPHISHMDISEPRHSQSPLQPSACPHPHPQSILHFYIPPFFFSFLLTSIYLYLTHYHPGIRFLPLSPSPSFLSSRFHTVF